MSSDTPRRSDSPAATNGWTARPPACSSPPNSASFPALVLALSVALASGCASTPPPAPPQAGQFQSAVSAPRRLGPPEHLSSTARSILRTRMSSHARDMGALMSAVMILDYPEIREGSERIAADASLARPLSADATELNSALPARFFDLQDDLKDRSRTLGAAAARNDAFQVADAYGKLSQTCVSCHGVYRQGRSP